MEKDLVSVIMPSYNASRFIGASIDSVLNQTYGRLELLISDDHSTDSETIDLLKEYAAKDDRVRLFLLPENNGPGYARNNSIKEARGQYIAFCDSDDRWMPDKLEKQIAFMKKQKCCLSFSSYLVCGEDDEHRGIVIAPSVLTLSSLKHDNKIGCLTAIYDTKPHGKFFMPTIRKRQDWALFLTILQTCGKAYGMVEPLAIYRKTAQGISRNKFKLINYNAKVYQHVFKYSVPYSYIYLFTVFMPTYFFKRVTNWIANIWR
ncbi:MAG: glycosyltransferase [Bacteroidaceae bacterium]|nr:glycosyltransferase [Bacteroidaceae bacterium]